MKAIMAASYDTSRTIASSRELAAQVASLPVPVVRKAARIGHPDGRGGVAGLLKGLVPPPTILSFFPMAVRHGC